MSVGGEREVKGEMEQEKKDDESTTIVLDFVLKLSKTFNQRAPY